MTEEKRPVGRPKGPRNPDAHINRIQVMLSDREIERLQPIADRQGVSLSRIIRLLAVSSTESGQ